MLVLGASKKFTNLRINEFTSSEQGIDFGAAGGEVGGDEGNEDEQEFGDGEVVVVVVEKDVDSDVKKYAHYNTHDDALEQFVRGYEIEVAE